MMNPRTRRVRESARYAEENGASPSFLEMFATYAADRVARSAMRRVRRGVHEIVRWTVLRLILGWVGAAVLTGSIFLLLAAGVKGLEALHWPLWLACLSTGAFAILVVLVAIRGILRPKGEEEDD